jgi:hypothetical protein
LGWRFLFNPVLSCQKNGKGNAVCPTSSKEKGSIFFNSKRNFSNEITTIQSHETVSVYLRQNKPPYPDKNKNKYRIKNKERNDEYFQIQN